MKTFDDYRREYFTGVRRVAGRIDLEGPLRLPEAFALRLMWGHETGVVAMPDGQDGRAARILFAKLTNEILAFVGAVRVGSLHGAWHHVRAIIEVRAAIHYLWLADPAERIERIERYLSFLDAVGWLRLQEARNAGDILRAQIYAAAAQRAGRTFPEAEIDRWARIFRADIRKRPQSAKWHPGVSITQMIRACDPSRNAAAEYWAYSHATHASPLGGRLGGDTLRLVGFDWAALPGAVDSAMGHAHFAVTAFDEALGTQLRGLVRGEMDEFLKIRAQNASGRDAA